MVVGAAMATLLPLALTRGGCARAQESAALGFTSSVNPRNAGAAINLDIPLESVAPAQATTAAASIAALPARERLVVRKAIARFNSGEYRAATRTLRPTVEDERATPAVRQFYAITLFAQDRVSTAAYELLRAAKKNPRGFFHNAFVKQAYRHNSDFASHLRRARRYCRHTHQAELGLLGAYYQYLAGHKTAAAQALALIKPRRRDKTCIAALRVQLRQIIAAAHAARTPAVATSAPLKK